MNLVERFFAEITAKRIRRGSYSSVDDLEGAIYDYLLQHNAKPNPFVWSKTAKTSSPANAAHPMRSMKSGETGSMCQIRNIRM
jgi:hypothetical protein